jgi:SAM-dependent methyltransferase
MENNELSHATKIHYEELIGRIGEKYIDYRWKRHPVSQSHYRHTRKAVEFAFEHFGGGIGNLMEIGCGPGTWTDICLRHSKSMTIVDISNEMLKVVRNRFAGAPIDFHCGDFISRDISLPGPFDLIFSARALEYMDDKRAMVEKCASLLMHGGRLVIITKNPAWLDKRKERQSTGADVIHRDWVSHQDLERYYSANGLEDVVTFPVCLGSYYPPLNNRLAIKVCDLVQDRVYRRKITSNLDFITESYMTIGRMPDAHGNQLPIREV